MKTKRHKREIAKFVLSRVFSQTALLLSLIALSAVIVFILVRGLPYVNMQLLLGDYGKYPSIKPALVGTLYLIVISISISAPIGIGAAIFLTEYTKSKSRLIRTIRVATETLAG
ncbi:MAG: hypothetical protein FWE65_03160, partial [Eggerthellaceae bacterium]|nr:hypothetical protein [Eggerthellaceae bacterium]